MIYHGVTLSITFCRRPGERYAFVSDEHGIPIESRGADRWGRLMRMSNGKDGWTCIATLPVGQVPEGWV